MSCCPPPHRSSDGRPRPLAAAFLGLTTVVVALELVAAFDGSDDTDPWTDLVVDYVPAEVTFPAIGALALRLPVHFTRRYLKRRKTPSRERGRR